MAYTDGNMQEIIVEADSTGGRELSPVAIGGVGGSGTRLIAEVLSQLGFYMGGDLNAANDNLWFTLLFKRAELLELDDNHSRLNEASKIFLNAMVTRRPLTHEERAMVEALASADRSQHKAAWLEERAESLLDVTENSPLLCRERWGWKEPNTHVFLDHLKDALPQMRYVHVIRNGLDMAHSRNQQQLRLWGGFFLGARDFEVNPRNSLKYWCRVHYRVLDIGRDMGDRFLLLDYDDFCSDPGEGLRKLATFLGLELAPPQDRALREKVSPPESMGRFRQHGLHVFDGEDVEFARSLGFDTSERRV